MAIAEFYESLSDAKKVHVLQDGKTIAENFPCVKNWKEYKIVVNKCWNEPSHIVCPSDSIIIRKVPLGLDPLTLTVVFVSAVFGLYGGIEGYKAKKDSEKALKELERLKNNAKDEIINLPYLKGASNSIATGKTQPYIIGKNLFTPYILNAGKNYRGYSTISGTDGIEQFYNVVFECGFNKQNIREVFCDDITLKSFSSIEIPEGKYSLNESVFSSPDSFLEFAQDGKPFETSGFNQKIIERQYNDILKQHDKEHPEEYQDLFYTLESNAMGVDVCILFNGLRKYLDDGTPGFKERTIVPSYSLDYATLVKNKDSDPLNHATWVEFKFNQNGTESNFFSRNTLSQIRFNAHADFDFDDMFINGVRRYSEPVTIRISTDDEKPTEGSEYSDTYVQWIHSYCYDVKKSKTEFVPDRIIGEREASLSTLMGLRIKSTKANEDKLKSIQIVTSGLAKTYNENKRVWGSSKKATSNPASWCLEVLISECHNPSKVEESDIDLPSFAEWYVYCQNNNLTVNHVITSGMTKSALFDLICDCGHGYLYQNIYGKIAVAIDCPKENAIAVLNEQNMISFSYTKDFRRKPDGLKLTYIDEASGFQENTVMIMYDGSDPEERTSDTVIATVNVQGKTNNDEVCRHGYYLMKKERLRPKVAKATIGNEGLFFTPLSKVLVQHPSLKIGKGNGEIKSLILSADGKRITGLELYDSVDLSENTTYTFIVQCVGTYGNTDYCTPLQIEVVGGKGITEEIEFVTPISVTAKVIPHVSDVFSYGLGTENVVSEMLISGIESSDNGFILSLVDYDERIYNNEQTIPEYIPDFSTPQKNVAQVPEKPIVSFDDLYGTKKDIVEYVDSEIEHITLDVAPTYEAQFNSFVIRKDKDGSFTPSSIICEGKENHGLDESVPFIGTWKVYVNDSETTYLVADSSRIEININDIVESGIDNINSIRVVFSSLNESVVFENKVIPMLTNASAYSVVLETPFQTYEADENGNIPEYTLKTKVHVYYGLQELTYLAEDGWEYGIIPQTNGFDVSLNVATGEITIKALQGSAMAMNGRITIPVFIHSQTNTEITIGYKEGNQEITIGYDGMNIGYLEPDENGYFYSFFNFQKLTQNAIKLAQLTADMNNYWNILTDDLSVTVAEKNTLEVLLKSVQGEFNSYNSAYSDRNSFNDYQNAFNVLQTAISQILASSGNYTFSSQEEKNTFNGYFENYYSKKNILDEEIASVSVNFKGIDKDTRIQELKPKKNDYFVWIGANNTRYGTLTLQTGMTYCWNGSMWTEDDDSSHVMATMTEALSVIQNSTSDSIPAVVFAKRIIAMKVITDELFSNFATVGMLQTTNEIVSLKADDSKVDELAETVSDLSDDVDGKASQESVDTLSNIVNNKADKTELNKKRTVFTTTPTVPYSIGDLWVRTISKTVTKPDGTEETVSGKVIYYAKTSKTSSQSYNVNDWEEGDKLQNDVLKKALTDGDTTIIGGYINTDLIEVDKLMAQTVTIKDVLKSEGLTGIEDTVHKGFFVDKDGNARINNLIGDNVYFKTGVFSGSFGERLTPTWQETTDFFTTQFSVNGISLFTIYINDVYTNSGEYEAIFFLYTQEKTNSIPPQVTANRFNIKQETKIQIELISSGVSAKLKIKIPKEKQAFKDHITICQSKFI